MGGIDDSDIIKNEHYIKYSKGYYTQCIVDGDRSLYKEIPCKPDVCHGDVGECDTIKSTDFHEKEHNCLNTYERDGENYYQCIMDGGQCNKQREPTKKDCIPGNLHPEKDYNRCYKESSKYIKNNNEDTDYIVTLF